MVIRFQPVTSIFDEIDTIVNSSLLPLPGLIAAGRSGRFSSVSMKDSGEQIHVTVELPGVEKQDVKVNINDGILTISAERKQPELKAQEQWIRNEIQYGTFERSIALPYTIDAEKVTAQHENGILEINLPKHENAKMKQISIR